ncbi:helix-turn-helix domain-containing protein [Shimia sp. SDUM112013]|uniref:helix-turn-helix domain-containing protein n=1 Tax=Shimia sp. SDUM112013 TaxID=3136160 RepID=UPI0032EE9CAE
MQRKMVNLLELTKVVDLLGRFASRQQVDEALRATGLTRAMLRKGAGFLPYATEAVLIETVARAIGDRHLGARIGQAFEYATYGAYAQYVLGAPDLATALDRGRRALFLTHPGSVVVMRQTATHLVVGRNSRGLSVVGHRHLDEGALFVIGDVARHFLGKAWQPDWVEIPEANAEDLAGLTQLAGVPIRTGTDMPAVAIRLSDLATRNPGAPSPDRTLSLEELTALMGVAPAQNLRDEVMQMLHLTGATIQTPNEAAIARLMAITPRSLQRALRALGTSFRALRATYICARAKELLLETNRPVAEIGRSLGYREPRSFRRAFRDWTGQSPAAFRATGALGTKGTP